MPSDVRKMPARDYEHILAYMNAYGFAQKERARRIEERRQIEG